jgi:hypothetical protein
MHCLAEVAEAMLSHHYTLPSVTQARHRDMLARSGKPPPIIRPTKPCQARIVIHHCWNLVGGGLGQRGGAFNVALGVWLAGCYLSASTHGFFCQQILERRLSKSTAQGLGNSTSMGDLCRQSGTSGSQL